MFDDREWEQFCRELDDIEEETFDQGFIRLYNQFNKTQDTCIHCACVELGVRADKMTTLDFGHPDAMKLGMPYLQGLFAFIKKLEPFIKDVLELAENHSIE